MSQQKAFVLLRTDMNEYNDSDSDVISVHSDLQTANAMAKCYVRAEMAEHFMEPVGDYLTEDYFDGRYHAEVELGFEGDDRFDVVVLERPFTPAPGHGTKVGQQYVYVITREDFEHPTTSTPTTSNLGTYATLAEANRVALELCDEEVENSPCYGSEEDDSENAFGGVVLYRRTFEDERDNFIIEVHRTAMVGSSRSAARPATTPNAKYGETVTIPRGKALLRGATFMFTGQLETLSRTAAQAAVKLYGGSVALSSQVADYAVVGKRPHSPEKQELITTLAIETLTEAQFYALLKTGVPEDKILRCQRFQSLGGGRGARARSASVAFGDVVDPAFRQATKRQRRSFESVEE